MNGTGAGAGSLLRGELGVSLGLQRWALTTRRVPPSWEPGA